MELPQRHREHGVSDGIFWGSELMFYSRLHAESSKPPETRIIKFI
jgi:hypothetical protein